MNHIKWIGLIAIGLSLASCGERSRNETGANAAPDSVINALVLSDDGFAYEAARFADVRILRYQLHGFDRLTPQQKELVYYLTQAGLAGRDIMWDQNYRHNLEIRTALEHIYRNYAGDRSSRNWKAFDVYLHQVWMSNGIHHHYSNLKHQPKFPREYFHELCASTGATCSDEIIEVIFDPSIAPKKVEQDAEKGLVEGSSVNFYGEGVTTQEAQNYYKSLMKPDDRAPLSYGINANLIKEDGQLKEEVYRIGGKYSDALEQVIFWLEKAVNVAENDRQAASLRKLIEFYRTGDLRTWDQFNILWASTTEGDIDFIHGFVEVYNDPLGNRGSYESIIEITDFEASERMKVIMEQAQWFEDNSPILPEHKKEKVTGVLYKVVNVAGESGDASPSTPIGVNLPNAQWIRAKHGSKSVSLGNIEDAYNKASGGGMTAEFAHDEEEIERARLYGELAGKIHTALHEVIGHASGKLEDGVAPSSRTLEQYASTIEEGRADLVALYYVMDPKLVEMGIMPNLEVGKCEYDGYIRNGLLVQLRRLKEGENLEEAHMRNRAFVSNWLLEKGQAENVIARVVRNGKTYYDITNYDRMRELVGELLREVQRITSAGDFEAARALADGYGKKVDPAIHREVISRSEKLNIPPYGGFMNPILTPVTDESGAIIDVKVSYADTFKEQMLTYSEQYGFLVK